MFTMKHTNGYGDKQNIAIAFRYHYNAANGYSGLSEFAHASVQVWYAVLDSDGQLPSDPNWDTLGSFAWQSNLAKPEDHPEAKYPHNGRGPIQPHDARTDYNGNRAMYGPLYAARLEHVDRHWGDIKEQFANAATLGKLWAKLEQVVTKYNLSYRWPEDEFCPIVAAARVLGIMDLEIDDNHRRETFVCPRFYPSLRHDNA